MDRPLCPLPGRSSWTSSAPAASPSPLSSPTPRPLSSARDARPFSASPLVVRRDSPRAALSGESRWCLSTRRGFSFFLRHNVAWYWGHLGICKALLVGRIEANYFDGHNQISLRIEDGFYQKDHLAEKQKGGAFGVRISCIINSFFRLSLSNLHCFDVVIFCTGRLYCTGG